MVYCCSVAIKRGSHSMFKRNSGDKPADAGKDTLVADRVRAVSSAEDLRRHAEWERLADEDRAALLRALPALTISASGGDAAAARPLLAAGTDVRVQEWLASLLSAQFQREPALIVQRWLEQAAPDAHLFFGGGAGQGRTSLTASLARKAMAKRPVPPEYCYVPDFDALDRPSVLAVPRGMGADFAEALGDVLSAISKRWDAPEQQEPQGKGDQSSSDAGADNNANNANNANGATPAQWRDELLARYLDPLIGAAERMNSPQLATATAGVRGYLQQLRAALVALKEADSSLPFASDSVPVAHVTPIPDALPATGGTADADSSDALGAPVVVASLTSTNLTNALLRANGGVLILPGADVCDAETWVRLTGALRAKSLMLKDGWPAVPLAVRVVLIGTDAVYQALPGDEFYRYIRNEAWGNWDTEWNRQAEATYAAYANGVAKYYGLPPFDPSGVARLVEEGGRRMDGLNRTRLTVNLLLLHDLAYEAAQKAVARGAAATAGTDVEAALDERRALQGASARRVISAIMTGEEMTPTNGTAIGQINGLGVYDTHPVERSFAVPMRISATVSLGKDERIVDIEQEASTTDADHVRGLLTMEGYLTHRYGQMYPISIEARIRFEQEHGAMGGDSASSAMLFAVLSALAQAPIRRSLAVTGAVGQYGEMQPIGSVNTKIEGFWALCRARRARGEQPEGGYGVVIPAVNTRDLMLLPAVAASIATEGWFNIWPISTVDEGLQVLTGLPAATIHQRVEQRLRQFYELSRRERGAR